MGATPARLAALVRDRVLDAELAGLLWLLAEARLPLVVAGEPSSLRPVVRAALLDLLPVGTRTITLRGEAETFDWLPEAARIGWRGEPPSDADPPREPASPSTIVLIADLEDRPPAGTWGEQARVAIRAVAIGYGMAATTAGNRLEGVLGGLAAFPVAAIDDELTRLGVVLVLAADEQSPAGGRVAAAHYLRPVQRDVHGHVQRLPPAVLATWDPAADRFEHFAWGIADELAGRTGRRASELEREQARRAGRLAVGIGPASRP